METAHGNLLFDARSPISIVNSFSHLPSQPGALLVFFLPPTPVQGAANCANKAWDGEGTTWCCK